MRNLDSAMTLLKKLWGVERTAFRLVAALWVAGCLGSTVFAQAPFNPGGYSQDFNSLAVEGVSANLPLGWVFNEDGISPDGFYVADNGNSAVGGTYSYGSLGSPERAVGSLRSSQVASTFGVFFKNNTGVRITSLSIAFTGEQWRLGATGREDRLDFAFSTNATALTNGNWTNVPQLSFVAPVTSGSIGTLNGNGLANQTYKLFTLTGLNINVGETLFLRWTDFDAAGEDDGLAVDDLLLIPNPPASVSPTVSLLQSGVAQASGSTFNFGTVAFGSSVDIPFVLQNTSTTNALNVSNLSVSGNGYSIIANPFPGSILPGASTSFIVRYTANVSGTVAGLLTIDSNDPASPYGLNLSATAGGVVNIALGGSYAQDFNTLPTTGQVVFTNVAPMGWYSERSGTGVHTIAAGNGSDIIGNLYSFGAIGATDRGLGSIGSASTTVGDMFWGVVVRNNGNATIPNLNIRYKGEQWRIGGANAVQDMTFSYKKVNVLNSSLQGTGWVSVPALTFNSPRPTGSAAAIDGNLSTNSETLTTTIPVDLAPGEYIVLRWFDANHLGNDHGLGIDDVVISAPTVNATISVSAGGNNLTNNSTYDFGSVVLDGSGAVNVTITNSGTVGTLNISDVSILNSEFVFNTPLPINIAPGASQVVSLQFVPAILGQRNGAITFTSNDPTTPNLTINLTGFATGYVALGAAAYAQDFNTLPASGTAIWNNNNIVGWYNRRTGNGTTIVTGDGSANAGGLYSFGAGGNADRALGNIGNATQGDFYTGVLIKNTAGAPFVNLNVGFTGEQWRRSGANASQMVEFAYKISDTPFADLQGTGWVNFTDMNFSSPQSNGAATALDGNLANNRVVLTGTLPVTLQAGQYIMLRWFDPDHAGADHGLAVDDFNVVASLTAPDITVAQGNTAIAPGSTYDFGVAVVDEVVNRTFRIANPGAQALTIINVNPVGSDFTFETTLPITIQPGQTADVIIRYLPTASGNRTGSITLINNSVSTPNYTINFSAQATGWVAFGPGQSYFQDFNTLPVNGISVWDNNNINGWYAHQDVAGPLLINAQDGTIAQPDLYSFGAPGSTDRALGGIQAVQTGNMAYGLLLKNTGSAPLSSLNVGYFLEQWRMSGANGNNQIGFSYKVSNVPFSSLVGTDWVDVASLDGVSPQPNGNGVLNGNDPANRVAVNGIFPVVVQPGEYIMLRWFDADSPNLDHSLAIEDVKIVAAVPGAVIDVQQNNNPIADESTFDFGPSIVGATKDVVFTIRNLSDFSALTVNSGTTTGDFTVLNNPFPLTITAPGQANITVRFAPTANGTNLGSLTLNSNDPANPTYVINFTAISTAWVPLGKGDTYMQDFNTLPVTDNVVWNNTNVAGWYSERTGAGNTIVAGNGSSNTGGLYSFGGNGADDRALGTVGSGTTGDIFYGVLIKNVGTTVINELNISYIAEQWRVNGQNTTQTVGFSYKISDTPIVSLTGTGWVNFNALNFDSPQPTGPAGALDGNNPAYRIALNALLVTPLQPGQFLFLRWFDPDHLGNDHGLAIDDFMISAPTGGPEIVVQQNGIDVMNGQDFDMLAIVDGFQEVDFVIKNVDDFDNLLITNINVAGDGYSLLTQAGPISIPPGGATVMKVRFAPTATGPIAGSITITHDDVAQNPFIVTLNGYATGYVTIKEGLNYSQDFNALPTDAPQTWNNNNIKGWYAQYLGGPANQIVTNDGTLILDGLTSFGSAGSADRSLGALPSNNPNVRDVYWGVLIKNTGLTPLQALDISFLGEQWRASGEPAPNDMQTVRFAYKTSATPFADLGGTGWTNFTDLDFSSPTNDQPAGALDGNDPTNQVDLQKAILVNVPPGEFIMLRWLFPNNVGQNHGLSIDDLFIEAPVPTPRINLQFNGNDLANNATQNFGAAVVDEPVDVTFAIQNLSTNTPLVVSAAEIHPLGSPDFKIMNLTLPVTIQPGEFVNFIVRYTPSQIGLRFATLKIFSNDPNTPTFNLKLEGNATGYISLMNGGSYTQNFNSLPIDGDEFWDNNNILGWYAQQTEPGTLTIRPNTTNLNDSTLQGLYSYGAVDGPDRALGVRSGTQVGDMYYGVLIKNVGTTNIDTFDITYIAEQWLRRLGGNAQRVDFAYRKSPVPFSRLYGLPGWVDFNALDFTHPNTTGATAWLDGNAAGNRTPLDAKIEINLAPGEYVMLRWFDPDHNGRDHGAGIDDFTLFAPASCNVPANLIVTPGTVTENAATMQWDNPPISVAGSFNLRYRIFGSVTWTTVNDINGNDFQLIDLQNNTTYEVQVQSICGQGQTSEWSLKSTFTTLEDPAACKTPGGLYVESYPDSKEKVVIYWNTVPGIACYHLQYRQAGVTNWTNVPGTVTDANNPYVLDLLSSTSYEFRIRSRCGNCNNTNVSAFSPIVSFDTPLDCQFTSFTVNGGGSPINACKEVRLDIDGIQQSNFTYQWRKDDVNIIGAVGRKEFYTAFEPGTYTVRVRVGNCPIVTSQPVVVNVVPGIDSLIILSKTDVSCPGSFDGFVSMQAQVQQGVPTAFIRYSINGVDFQSSNVFLNLIGGTYTATAIDLNGCTATNTFTIEGSAPPSISFITVNSFSSATVNWTFEAQGFQRFDLEYRVLGAVEWTRISNLTGTSRQLTGLQNSTTYEVRIRGRCANGVYTEFSPVVTFNTPVNPAGACKVPGGFFVNVINPTEALVQWNQVTAATCYIVSYGPNATITNEILVANPQTTLVISNLTPGVNYTVRVRSNCTTCSVSSGTRSQFSNAVVFNTVGGKVENPVEATLASESSITDVRVYPNPSRGVFELNFEATTSEPLEMQLFDATGKLVFEQNASVESGANRVAVDATGQAAGIYLLQLRQGTNSRTIKVIIQ